MANTPYRPDPTEDIITSWEQMYLADPQTLPDRPAYDRTGRTLWRAVSRIFPSAACSDRGHSLLSISVRARKPAHSELDAVAGEFTPGFDLGYVRRLGKAAEHFSRLFPRLLA